MTQDVAVDRDVLLGIFDKLKVEYAPKIPVERAMVKLTRLLKKEPLLVANNVTLTKAECDVLSDLGVVVAVKVSDKAGKTKKGKKKSKTKGEAKVAKPEETSKGDTTKEVKRLVPPTGIIALMRRMLAKGKSKGKMFKLGLKKYHEAGYKDDEFINNRLEICLAFASKEEKPVAKKPAKTSKKKASKEEAEEKPAKKAKKGKAAKAKAKDEKPAKKGKKKAKAKDEEE